MSAARDDSGVRFPPPLVFLGFLLLGMLVDRVAGLATLGLERDWRLGIGIMLCVIGIVLIGAALSRFVGAGTAPEPWKPTTAIVERGVYRWTRNPMYLGMALLSAGGAVLLDSPGALWMGIGAVIAIDRIVIVREEKYLGAKFGDGYRAYRDRVRRWL